MVPSQQATQSIPSHKSFVEYVSAANNFYLSSPALWEDDFTPDGFLWIYPDMSDENTVVYKRIGLDGESVTVAVNFSGLAQRIRLYDTDEYGYRLAFVSSGYNTGIPMTLLPIERDGRRCVEFYLPARCAVVLEDERKHNTVVI